MYIEVNFIFRQNTSLGHVQALACSSDASSKVKQSYDLLCVAWDNTPKQLKARFHIYKFGMSPLS